MAEILKTEDYKEYLDKVSTTYRRTSPVDVYLREKVFTIIQPFLSRKTVLELGCSDGLMTELISREVVKLDVVDGSSNFIQEAKSRNLKNVTYHHKLFEEYLSDTQYDCIVATFILTHIHRLSDFFENVNKNLKPNGIFFVAVPNRRVFSRRLALNMGLYNSLEELTENDRNHGHCNSYDRPSLNALLNEYGFKSITEGGILFKILADFQMDQLIGLGILTEDQLNGLDKLGKLYPDFSNVIYNICIKK